MPELYTNFRWAFTGETQEMLVEDGRVIRRGHKHQGERPQQIIDLGGKLLMPAFIDSHCHILPTGLDLQKLFLGSCSTQGEVLGAVRDALRQVEPGKWLLAVHYDQTKFPDGKHLSRSDLDAISSKTPILLRHVNGHASVANSAALQAARIREDEKDPPGGHFERGDDGKLNGVLLELAHERVTRAVPNPTLEEMVDAILLAGDKMASVGIGCASDMMTGRFNLLDELAAYRIASERGCKIRTRLYLQWSEVFGPAAVAPDLLKAETAAMNPDRCRVAGVKIFADGAIGSATAAIYGRFLTHNHGGPVISRRAKAASKFAAESLEVDGQLIYAPDKLMHMARTAHEAGYQIATHTIGDYSTDLVMDVYGALDPPSRHRIEHAMLLSDQQIERMAKLGCFCTMQPEFLLKFAHSYRRQLGPERSAFLERARSVKDAGIRLSFSSDRPIVGGDPNDGIRAAVDRPDGFDASENLTPLEAVLAYTVEGARVNGDIDSMGELLPGQFADFQIREEPLSTTFDHQKSKVGTLGN